MANEPGPVYDLFISYAHADKPWVEGYLLDALTDAGICFHSQSALALGKPRLLEFERAIQQSRRVLLILSPAYWTDDSSDFINLLSQSYGLETATWPVIPLTLTQVPVPPRLSMLQGLDATDPANWKEVISRLCAELQHPPPPAASKISCPYPGMMPYSAKEAPFFYGRETEIEQMLQHFRHHRCLWVIGSSGSGKSSLVNAGLLPKLLEGNYFPPGYWVVRSMRPGPRPTKELEEAIEGDICRPGDALTRLLGGQIKAQRVFLVIDQFEEIFTQSDRAEQGRFIAALKVLRALDNCALLITMRADFYADLMNTDIWPVEPTQRLEIAQLRGQALRKAIEGPATKTGVYLENGLLERIFVDAADEPGILPLLQEAMVLVWAKMQRHLLTLSSYIELGGDGRSGIAVALVKKADAILADLPTEQKAIARRIFLRLVQFGEGRADTRRQQLVADLASVGEATLFELTMQCLVKNRLLTLSGQEKRADKKVDIAHEALITVWPTLHKWINERRDAEKTRRRLEAKVQEWDRLGGGSGGLLDAVELAEARQWMNSTDAAELGCGNLPNLIQASEKVIQRAEQEKEAARQLELQQAHALAEERRIRLIETQRMRSLTIAQSLAAQAHYELYEKPQRSLLLAIESVRIAEKAGEKWFPASLQVLRTALSGTGGTPILEHSKAVSSIAFSPRGEWLASGCHDRTIRLIDLSKPNTEPVVLIGPKHIVSCISFSPCGRWLASGSGDGTVRVWSLTDLKAAPVILAAHTGPVFSIAFSTSGNLLASGGRDQKVRLWSMADFAGKPVTLHAHRGWVTAVAFSPNGHDLATGGEDQIIRVIRVSDLKAKPMMLSGHEGTVTSLAFSPDGKLLASAAEDQTIRIWNMVDTKARPMVLRETRSAVKSLAFSPKDGLLASGCADQLVRLWDTADLESGPYILMGHEGSIHSIAFSPNGELLASGSEDRTVRMWHPASPIVDPVILFKHFDLIRAIAFSPRGQMLAYGDGSGNLALWHMPESKGSPSILHGHDDSIRAVAFSPDGRWLASASRDHRVILWDTESYTAKPIVTPGITGAASCVAFSPNGRFLASGNWDKMLYLWNVSDSRADMQILEGHDDSVFSIAYSPDGAMLASGGRDQTVRLWDTANLTKAPIILYEHAGPVYCVVFSPNGRFLASGSEGQVHVWDRTSLESGPVILTGHTGPVYSTAFSPDSLLLASGSGDQTIRLWNTLELRSKPVVLDDHRDAVYSVAFNPDGRLLASGGHDRKIRLWRMSIDELLSAAGRAAGRKLTLDERRQFLGDE